MQSSTTSFLDEIEAFDFGSLANDTVEESIAWVDDTLELYLDESLWNGPDPIPEDLDDDGQMFVSSTQPGVLPGDTLPMYNPSEVPTALPVPMPSILTDTDSVDLVSQPNSESTVPSNKRRMTEEDRRKLLEEDEFLISFDAKQVLCSGCRKTLKLDGREHARYYYTFWLNHKKKCPGVKAGMTAAIRKREDENETIYRINALLK